MSVRTTARDLLPSEMHQPQQNGHQVNGASATSPNTADWLYDPVEALERETGPYTVLDMEKYVDDYQIELYNGWLVWRDMGYIEERTVVSTIQAMLDISARKQGIGQALPDGTECRLDEGNDIIPDACLVTWQRLEDDVMEHGPNKRPLLIKCPELIVESRSESNTRKGDALKRAMYFANGTEIVWDVDEEHEFIDVYWVESPTNPHRYVAGDTIDCEPLLPGWRRSISDIFAKQVSAEAVAGEVAEEWRKEGHEEGRKKGRKEGREEGIEIGLLQVAQNLFQAGMEIDTVAQMTNLPHARLQAIQQEGSSAPSAKS